MPALIDFIRPFRLEEGNDRQHLVVIEFVGKGLPIVIESARVEAANKRIRATYEVSLDSYLGSDEDDVPVIFN